MTPLYFYVHLSIKQENFLPNNNLDLPIIIPVKKVLLNLNSIFEFDFHNMSYLLINNQNYKLNTKVTLE